MLWTPPTKSEDPISVTVPSQVGLLKDLRERLTARDGFAVATLNLDHVVKLRDDSDFRVAYLAHTHVTADGRPIVWLSRYARQPVELVTGSDLVEPMMSLCADMSVPVALVGSSEAVLAKSGDVLQARYSGLNIVSTISPPMGFDPVSPQADSLIDDVVRSGARVCFLALGAPKQEILAARALKKYPQMGFLSIGASLDFIAGKQVRAPRLVRAFAAEWLWRLARDPRRLATRYGACFAALPRLFIWALQARRSTGQGRERGA